MELFTFYYSTFVTYRYRTEDFVNAKRYTCKLTGGKQNSHVVHLNEKKSNNPLPHNTEKSVALVYYVLRVSLIRS